MKPFFRGLLAALVLTGCASPASESPRLPRLGDLTGAVAELFGSDPRSKSDPTAAALYQDGIDYFERGRYARSISFFQKLRDDYPFSEEAEAAELKIADAYFRNGEYAQADETYKNYLTFQPTGRHIPDVKYQLGRVNLAQFRGVDRDLEKVRQASGYFASVVKDHPESEHVEDARKRLAEARVHLAEREFYVGSHYVTEGRHPAARERFDTVLREYGDTAVAARARVALAALPAAGQGAAATPPAAARVREGGAAEPQFITKPGYEYEDASRTTWYGYLNPFSWGGRGKEPQEEAVASAPQAAAGEVEAAIGETAPAAQEKGWFGFLNPATWFGGEAEQPAAPVAAAPAVSASAVMEGVDRTLGTGESSADGAPKPPVSGLPPEEKDTGPVPEDPAKVIGEIDSRLGGAAAAVGAPPAADPALFSVRKREPGAEEAAAEQARSTLLEGIDRQLRSGGIDGSRELRPPPASP